MTMYAYQTALSVVRMYFYCPLVAVYLWAAANNL